MHLQITMTGERLPEVSKPADAEKATVAVLFAALTLFVSYFPYPRPIGSWTSDHALLGTYLPFFLNLSPVLADPISEIWRTQMVWPCLWCAVESPAPRPGPEGRNLTP
jgi:hypothetical protein